MKPWLVVMVFGCAAGPAEPLSTPEPIPHTHEIIQLAAPRPAIDITDTTPDLAPYGRWPLTVAEHPELDPHFAIADALAQPGITWQDLCARGAQFRHMSQNAELGDYLAAWCSVAKEDYGDALYRLGLVPRTPKLKHAIEMDAVAILAAGIPGNEAEGALRHASLIELHIVDLAAASYFEVSKLDDAYALNRLAIEMDATPTETNRCTRLLRAAADGTDVQRWIALDGLARLADPPDANTKAQCVEVANQFACGDPKQCEKDALRKRDSFIALKALADRWPMSAADYGVWIREAQDASRTWPPTQAYRIMVPALELALRTSRCDLSWLSYVATMAEGLETVPGPDFNHMRGVQTTNIRIPLQGDMLVFEPRLEAIASTAYRLHNTSYAHCLELTAALPPVSP